LLNQLTLNKNKIVRHKKARTMAGFIVFPQDNTPPYWNHHQLAVRNVCCWASIVM